MRKHTYFRTKYITVVLLILLFPLLTVLSASDYDRAFVQKTADNLSIQALSPYKNSQASNTGLFAPAKITSRDMYRVQILIRVPI